jgi:hypothetical protein
VWCTCCDDLDRVEQLDPASNGAGCLLITRSF